MKEKQGYVLSASPSPDLLLQRSAALGLQVFETLKAGTVDEQFTALKIAKALVVERSLASPVQPE